MRVEGDAHVDATLTPFASVHGRVTDPEGKPAAGVTVQMTPLFDSTTVTDAEGNFGFSKLRPGSYTLAAKPKEAQSRNGERLVTTYFPSDADLEDAEPIVVAGVDLFGYEIRLKAAAVHALHGVVTGADGKPVAHAVVNLLKPGSGPVTWVRGNYNTIAFHRLPTQSQQVEAGEDGSFEFAEVLDGAWRVQAQTAAEYDYQRHTDLVRGSGGVDLNVSGREPEPVEIRLTPAFSLDVVEEWGDQAPSHPRAMFNVLPMDDLLSNPDQADFEKTHRIEGLLAGRHLFEPGQFPTPGYYLSAAQLNGQDVLGQAAELLGPGTLRLVFRGDGGSVRGTVTKGSGDKAAGALVLLMTQRADGGARGLLGVERRRWRVCDRRRATGGLYDPGAPAGSGGCDGSGVRQRASRGRAVEGGSGRGGGDRSTIALREERKMRDTLQAAMSWRGWLRIGISPIFLAAAWGQSGAVRRGGCASRATAGGGNGAGSVERRPGGCPTQSERHFARASSTVRGKRDRHAAFLHHAGPHHSGVQRSHSRRVHHRPGGVRAGLAG